MGAPAMGHQDANLARTQALVDAQRSAIRHPNPRVALALSQRVQRTLPADLTPEDLPEAVALRDAMVGLAGQVQAELDRLRLEILHHMGTDEGPATTGAARNHWVG